MNVVDAGGVEWTPVSFYELTGSANPFDGIDVGLNSTPSFVDLDGDGDLDLVLGAADGTLRVYDNNDADAGFTELTGTANPLSGIDVSTYGNLSPSFGDLDGDGNLDLVVGEFSGTLRVYDNNTNAGFTELTGTANPYNGVDVGFRSSPSFADLDGDGDLDLVVGSNDGTLISYENTTPPVGVITVHVTPDNDAPTATGLPASIVVDEATASNVDLSGVAISDAEGDEAIQLTIVASSGVLNAASGADVTVLLSGGDTLQLFGTAPDLNTYLQNINAVQFTGAQDLFGDGVATLTVSTTDRLGEQSFQGTVQVNITDIVETQTGDAGANTLLGGLGVDVLSGGDGNDFLRGLGGADTLDGGDGKDWLQYKGSDFGVTVDLNADLLGFQPASDGHATGDVISGFENVRGSAFADTLTGNDGKNALRGGGADTLDGGLGNDWLIYKGSDAGVTVDLTVEGFGFQSATGGHAIGDVISGFERVRGSAHDDVLTGNEQNNRLKGAGGADTLDGGTGNDRLFGGAGSDVFIFGSGDGDDEINGGDGVDLAQFNGFDSTDFTVVDLGGSAWTVSENATGDVDTITGVEILQFDDTTLLSF